MVVQIPSRARGTVEQGRVPAYFEVPTYRGGTMQRWVCGDDAAICQITLGTCHYQVAARYTPLYYDKVRSASTEQLDVPTCRRSTIGGRAFPVAGAKVWNRLPSDVTFGLVAIGVQEQAEDILVPPLLRNCLTLMTFPFPSHYLTPRTVVLAIDFTV